MKVEIYPNIDVFYYSFYIEGFNKIFGKKNVRFSNSDFPVFSSRTLIAKISENGRLYRIVIDALDTTKIYKDELNWSDIYGKVNYNEAKIKEVDKTKILSIGPSFGIRIWSLQETIYYSILNFFRIQKNIKDKRYHFTSYWRQYKRLPLSSYKKGVNPKCNYIYFISSLWAKEYETNKKRAQFIEVCENLDYVNFEGGFAPRSDGTKLGFDHLIDKRIPLKVYLKKIKKSFLVFNTPAVQNCHGWKLAEYLALGKPIISADLSNVLPAPLTHGHHLHFVSSDKGEIKDAIFKLFQNKNYREKISLNAQDYFTEHLHPVKVIEKLINNISK